MGILIGLSVGFISIGLMGIFMAKKQKWQRVFLFIGCIGMILEVVSIYVINTYL
jgi:hypothetical protein